MLNFLLNIIYKYNKLKHGEYPLSILYYHHVFSNKNSYHLDDLDEHNFDQQISFLTKHFNILSLKQAIELLKQKRLPSKALVISFDDGYQDNYTLAAPILEKNKCPATFFIATEGVKKGYLWNDIIEQNIKNTTVKKISKDIIGKEISLITEGEKTSAFHQLVNSLKFVNNDERNNKILQLSKELNINNYTRTMMNEEQILDLHNRNFTIGAHTHSHTILSTETDENSQSELLTNKQTLEKTIGEPVEFLAFPNGLYGQDFKQVHCEIASALGFEAAFSTNDGGAVSATNLHQIPRFMPYRKQLPLFALSIAKIAGEHV
jgi:peptidoglycan/xylan/chitin deacetylase (PgdA/CDA1 family)